MSFICWVVLGFVAVCTVLTLWHVINEEPIKPALDMGNKKKIIDNVHFGSKFYSTHFGFVKTHHPPHTYTKT